MAFFIQFPDDPSAHGSAGAKASVLARLINRGFPVPPWFVIAAEAFSGNLSMQQREAMAAAKTPMTLAASVAELALTASFLEEVDEAIQRLCPNGEPVVVRPSLAAADVDSYDLASTLPLKIQTRREDVGVRIADIYRSAYSEPVLVQRRRFRLPLCPDPPAVLIQRLVNPEASGAAFGSDLTTGQRTISVVAAVFGLPSSMSSGDCQPDLYRIDRSGKVVQRDIATKTIAHRPVADEDAGYVGREVPTSEHKAPVLSAKDIARIWAMLGDVERSFECPQEVHWALEADKLYLLDASPLTQLDRHADPDSPTVYLDSGALAEFLPGAVLPLTASLAQRVAPQIARAFLRGAGLSDAAIARSSYATRNLLSIVRSRVYANLESWYALFAALPDYPYNARFYGRMTGWSLNLPPQVERGVRHGGAKSSAGFGTALGMYRGFSEVSARVKQFHKSVEAALKAIPRSIDRLRLDELADCFRMIEQRLLPVWDAPPLNEYYTLIAYGYLNQHVRKLWPDEHAQALVGLLSKGGRKWLPPSIGKIQEIALTVANDLDTVDILRAGSLDEIYGVISGRPEFRARCEEYIAKHAAMTFGGCKLEAAPLADDPLPFFRAVAQAATLLSLYSGDDAVVLDIPSRDDVLAAPNIGPIQRRKLIWLTEHARARFRDRELIAADVAYVIAAARNLFTEIGRRYYALGFLGSPRDIFYLTVDEVLGSIEATVPVPDIAGIVNARRAHYEELAHLPPPMSSFAVHLPVTVGNQVDQKPSPTVPERVGAGVSPGFVRGRAWLAGTPKPPSIKGPFVLVAEYADPSWPMLYPGVDGIVIEKGGALSLAVLGYRDQRIATVIGVANLTTWLANGDLVDVDGSTGVVRKVDDSDQVYAVPESGSVIKRQPESSEQATDLPQRSESDRQLQATSSAAPPEPESSPVDSADTGQEGVGIDGNAENLNGHSPSADAGVDTSSAADGADVSHDTQNGVGSGEDAVGAGVEPIDQTPGEAEPVGIDPAGRV